MSHDKLVNAVLRVDGLMVDGKDGPADLRTQLADIDAEALADRLYDRLRARGVNADDAREQAAELAIAMLGLDLAETAR
ncbi:hypothetical protein [Actinoplanes aureus]|uniref:Uncharacterized protein n=1 Tax=Actinoplanes aureus TaxID=2792083 RepID=A0A931FXC2_9ACTN|nr:hypothetical protein [Actinoplanes aureus]MBG0560701.1 hypothetical protein [Actinoplanes aureus]